MEKKELFRIMAAAAGRMLVLGRPPMAVCCVSWLSRWLKNMVSAL